MHSNMRSGESFSHWELCPWLARSKPPQDAPASALLIANAARIKGRSMGGGKPGGKAVCPGRPHGVSIYATAVPAYGYSRTATARQPWLQLYGYGCTCIDHSNHHVCTGYVKFS
eukprot:SAG25_NODE_1386_length_3146_cov_1.710863_2_plen_114_part_00